MPPDTTQPNHSLSNGFLLSIVIVGPTFFVAEMWGNRPLIDHEGWVWVPPAAIMAAGFFVGGLIAGRHRRRGDSAFNYGVVVAILTLFLIFIADVVRRQVGNQQLQLAIFGLWALAGTAAVLVGGLGGTYGRFRSIRAHKRQKAEHAT